MKLRRHSQPESFDERFYRALRDEVNQLTSELSADDQVTDPIAAALDPVLEKFASAVAANLEKSQRKLISSRSRYQRGFVKRLRGSWADALDRYYALCVCLEELGSDFNNTRRPQAARDQDHVFESLVGLHARACRTALEVHHLLSGGFPMGALARCRTLHELGVTAGVIQEYGRDPKHLDLGERYLLHDHVINYRDAIDYQKHCADIGADPFSDDEMAAMKNDRDAVVARFGTSFKNDNGWAAELIGKDRPTFSDLEATADLSHLRGYYKWASHEVHADAKGWRLNHGSRGDRTYVSSGHVNFGLADPGQLALHSLQLCTTLLILCEKPLASSDLVALMAIQGLIDKADHAFADAEKSIQDAEDRLQAEPGGKD
jgi:Family of unknown function (DUF5677)